MVFDDVSAVCVPPYSAVVAPVPSVRAVPASGDWFMVFDDVSDVCVPP